MVGKDSRFANVPIYSYIREKDGALITLFQRRKPLIAAKVSQDIDRNQGRIDLASFDHYRDAKKYWAVCDVNVETSPFDLLKDSGRVINFPSSSDVSSYTP